MTTERKLLGAKLKEAREYLGLSQEEVGRMLEIPRSAISLMESGQRKIDTVELNALSKLYERPISYFTSELFGSISQENVEILARLSDKVSKLTDEDREQVLKFAEYLASQSSNEPQ